MLASLLSGPQIAQGCLTAVVGLIVAVIGFVLNRKTKQIHVLVNSQMTQALTRIGLLEQKLGLSPGEAIPGPPIVTSSTDGGTE